MVLLLCTDTNTRATLRWSRTKSRGVRSFRQLCRPSRQASAWCGPLGMRMSRSCRQVRGWRPDPQGAPPVTRREYINTHTSMHTHKHTCKTLKPIRYVLHHNTRSSGANITQGSTQQRVFAATFSFNEPQTQTGRTQCPRAKPRRRPHETPTPCG